MAANNSHVADIAAGLTNVYESIGKEGQSAATKKGKVHALNYFVTFLGTLNPPLNTPSLSTQPSRRTHLGSSVHT